MELVIFDMDGLMYDTERLSFKCHQKAALQYGYHIDKEFGYSTIGMNKYDYHKIIINKFGKDYPFEEIGKISRDMRMDYFRKNGMIIKLGLKELIKYLKDNNIKIALASSSSRDTIDEYNALAKLDNVFDYIIAGNNVKHGKPNPEIFLKVLEHFKIDSNDAVVLEDSKNGILASHKANIKVICVPDLVEHSQDIIDLTYATVTSLFDVIEIIKKDLVQ